MFKKEKHGVSNKMAYIKLTNTDKRVIVDDEDLPYLQAISPRGNWYLSKSGYAVCSKGSMHCFFFPVKRIGYCVDHINRNKLDNRKSNLRYVSFSQNVLNRPKVHKNTYSKYKGVCWSQPKGKWIAYFYGKTLKKFLGQYSNEDDAARAYNAFVIKLDPLACLNQVK